MTTHETTGRLKLPFIMPSQAQKHVTHNEALVALDRLIHPAAISQALTVPPAAASEGVCYVVPSGATGFWTGHEGELAISDGADWAFLPPPAGFQIFIEEEEAFAYFDGTQWQDASAALFHLASR